MQARVRAAIDARRRSTPTDEAQITWLRARARGRTDFTEGRRNAQANRPQDHPDHRRRPDRHRAGLRVRLLRRAGLQGAARRGLPRRAGQLQPGDDHDRPGHGRRRLHRADQLADGREDHREGKARRAAADDGRPDRAELRARPGRPRRAREVRRRADRRLARSDPHGRGPRAVPRGDDRDRPGVPEGRGRAHARAGARHPDPRRLPDHHPPELHARRHRRRHRLQPRRVRSRSSSRGLELSPVQRSADRGIGAGLEGIRDGSGPRHARTTASSSARSRTSTRWACTPATRSPSRRRRR